MKFLCTYFIHMQYCLQDALLFKLSLSFQVELTGKLFTSDEKDFWQLPDLIVKKQTGKCNIMSNNASYGKSCHSQTCQSNKEE